MFCSPKFVGRIISSVPEAHVACGMLPAGQVSCQLNWRSIQSEFGFMYRTVEPIKPLLGEKPLRQTLNKTTIFLTELCYVNEMKYK